MSNLYEILEVSEKASKEVIDKAYHVLVKKYHPDLQQGEEKQNAEEKMKEINEAYEVLSNEEKRKEYDISLEEQREQEKIVEEQKRKQQINEYEQEKMQEQLENQTYYRNEDQNINRNTDENNNYQNAKKIQKEINRAYADAYNNYLRSLGYKVKEPWTFKRFLELLKVLAILTIIILIIWFFPPTHKLLIEFYENNFIIKTIVNVISNIFQGIWNGIRNFVMGLF